MKKAAWVFCGFAAIFIVKIYVSAGNSDNVLKRIEAKPQFYFNEVDKDIDWRMLFLDRMNTQTLAYDGTFFYVLDWKNHRIVKSDKNGKFVAQIGRVGEGDKSFKHPSAVFIQNQRLYIMDNGGEKIKIFDHDGKYIQSFEIPNAWMTVGWRVNSDGNILGATIPLKNYLQKKLISIYTPEGKIIGEFGEPMAHKDLSAFSTLNRCKILSHSEGFYIAFEAVPKIMSYSKKGEYLSTIDLSNKGSDAIDSLVERAENKLNIKNHIKYQGNLMWQVVEYNNGFEMDNNGTLYYATPEKTVISISSKGEIENQFRLTNNGKDLDIHKLLFVGTEKWAVVKDETWKKTGFYLVSF